MNIDAHARPPAEIVAVHKAHQKSRHTGDYHTDEPVFDIESGSLADFVPIHDTRQILSNEAQSVCAEYPSSESSANEIIAAYEHPSLPGLYVFPRLLPRDVQIKLLNDLLHTQLSNPAHLTNLHTHYDVPYPTPSSTAAPPSSTSFFDPSATNLILQPHDPEIHKPLTTSQVLSRKLRWMTLGGQYDWTEKAYPATESPESTPHFPIEIARLIQGLFPAITPQAAIVNVYSPGDTLSLHRDVSEECERPLVSVSIGCEALFVVGLDDAVPDEQPLPSTDATAEALQHNGIDGVSVAAQTKSVHAKRTVTLRLRSGDVLVMAGESRKAWHSVPRILPDTCPEWLADWPCMNQPRSEHVTADSASRQDAQYEAYRGWMRGKRLNLNVRQMHE